MGPEVQAFETEAASLLGVDHAFAVSSGTAALHLAYLALEIGDADEIRCPAQVLLDGGDELCEPEHILLTLGRPDGEDAVVLVRPDFKVPNGGKLF